MERCFVLNCALELILRLRFKIKIYGKSNLCPDYLQLALSDQDLGGVAK